MPTREEIFEQASLLMEADFERLRKTYTHAGSKGTEFEKIVESFLASKLPKRFSITSGFILDNKDQLSSQQDIIIYDAYNTPLYSYDSENAVVPNDNVATVVEVKATLTTDNLRECFQKTEKIKSLSKTLHDKSISRSEGTYFATESYIFAFSSSISLKKIAEIFKEESGKRVSKGLQIDGIFILNKGYVSLGISLPNGEWGPLIIANNALTIPGAKVTIFFQEFGRKTLDYFVRLILPHLAFFYQRVDHPGFSWVATPTENIILYEVPVKAPERNDPCFCPSEKKYKKCCGSET